jgi:hypothetical protein
VRQEQGVWFFDVTAAKTEAGVRKVPVHSEIIKAGFLEYVAQLPPDVDGRVFPTLRPGGPDGKLAHSDEAGRRFQFEAGQRFRPEAGRRSDLKPARSDGVSAGRGG